MPAYTALAGKYSAEHAEREGRQALAGWDAGLKPCTMFEKRSFFTEKSGFSAGSAPPSHLSRTSLNIPCSK